MKTRFEILNSLESIFLSIQDKINAIRPGSVIRSIFYSVASALEDAFSYLEDIKNNSYIHTATGERLDQLIYGLSKLKRIEGQRAFGYVTVTPINITIDSVAASEQLSSLIFSKYDLVSGVLYTPPLHSKISASTVNGIFEYALLPPVRFLTTYKDDYYYEINPSTGKQLIAEIFAAHIKSYILQNPNKRIKYIVLPVVSKDYGSDKNLLSSAINTTIQIGTLKLNVENNFDYTFNENEEIVVDTDSVANIESGVLTLGESSEIKGGTDRETDEEFRNRYWAFLNSLGKGTIPAIETKLSEILRNVKISAYTSTAPGIIDIYLYSNTLVLSPSLILLVQENIKDIKPAGTIVNFRIPKVNYINILVDTRENLTKNDVENLKMSLRDNINTLEIGESLSYAKLWEFLNQKDFSFFNPYFGLTLTAELFNLYKENLRAFVCKVYYESDTYYSTLPDFCTDSNASFTFYDYLNIVTTGKLAVFIYDKTNNYKSYNTNFNYSSGQLTLQAPKYPLKRIVSKILSGEQIGNTYITNAIRSVCSSIPSEICLREVTRRGVLDTATTGPTDPSRIAISIKHIENLDENYANYLKIKMLTLPISSYNDIELCESKLPSGAGSYCSSSNYEFKLYYSLLNDVQYYEYKELDEIQKDREIVRVFSSNTINKNYVTKYNIGIRQD